MDASKIEVPEYQLPSLDMFVYPRETELKSFHIAVFFSVICKIDPKGMPCELSTVKCVPQRSWKARELVEKETR